MGTSKYGALVVIIVLGGVVGILPGAFAEGATETQITDEPLTVDYDSPSAVAESGVSYNDTVTVTSGGSELTRGTDYEWNASNGTVTWQNTSSTSDGDSAAIDYRVAQQSDENRAMLQLLEVFVLPLALVILSILGMSWFGVFG